MGSNWLRKIRKLISLVRARRFRQAFRAVFANIPIVEKRFNRTSSQSVKDQKKLLQTTLREYYNFDPFIPRRGENYKDLKVDLILHDAETLPKSSAFIRLIGPLTYPSALKRLSLRLVDGGNPEPRFDADICIVQRTAISDSVDASNFIKKISNNGTKLVIDLDDAFIHIDSTHPEYRQTRAVLKVLHSLIDASDEIWVSTEELQSHYKTVTKPDKVILVRNSLDYRVWGKTTTPKFAPNKPLQLLYMGTATHGADFELIIPVLDKLYSKYPNRFQLSIIGVSPQLPQRDWLKTLSRNAEDVIYPRFVSWLQAQGEFDVGVAPLVNNKFNNSKSDIKALDYIGLGAVPFVSKVTPYNFSEIGAHLMVCSDGDEWYKELEEVITNIDDFRNKKVELMNSAKEYLWEKRSTEQTTELLLSRLSEIVRQ